MIKSLTRFALAVVFALLGGASFAQNYPSKPVRWVVPFPPGGPLDISARVLAQHMALGQPVVVENKPGAGGNVGALQVAQSEPDGHTILMGAVSTHAINPHLYRSLGYDPHAQLAPITQVVQVPNILILNADLPPKSVGELIAYAKARPGKLNVGSGSNGSIGHLSAELFKKLAGIDWVHIPYAGGAPAMNALIAGETQLMFDNLASALPQIKAGKVRALAVTTARRSTHVADLPTVIEAGLAGFDMATWWGAFAPAGTPKAAIDRLHAEITRAMKTPEVQERFAAMGATAIGDSPAEFAAFIKAEHAKYGPVVAASGARAD